MAGNPANASLWADADVYVAFDLEAGLPADASTEFGAEWDLVGLLDGEAGFVETRTEEITDHYAWGGIIVRTGRRNFKLTRQFTALEYNATTRRLAWPGSAEGERVVPHPEDILIAFEKRDDDKVHRLISAYRAECDVNGDLTENESELEKHPFVVTIFPDGDGVLFTEQTTEELGS
jgi:hypothetical protein